jgi:pimeloyl-ACP methyl ester carboxylesterase
MRRIPLVSLLIAAAFFVPAVASAVSAERESLAPCPQNQEYRCGKVTVFEDREHRAGRQIELNVVLVPAKTAQPAANALFYIAGGPGGSSVDEGQGFAPVLEPLRKTHDLVFVDLRGTGDSNRLGCVTNGNFENNLQGFFEAFLTRDQLRTCRAELERKADLRFYTTPLAVDDLEEVRRRFGYGKIDLLGTSYGTRAAQVFMKRHPDSVRSVLLMGVITLDALLPLTHAQGGERAFDLILTACLADDGCRGAFPNLRAEYEALWQRLDAAPAEIELKNPKTGKLEKVHFSRGNFAESIRFYNYDPAGGAVLPVLVHRAFLGDLKPFAEQVLASEPEFRQWLAWGSNLAVACSEDVPAYPADTTSYSRGTFLGDYRIAIQRDLCAGWVRGEVPAGLHDPVESDIPTLLVSGQLDPVTPPWMAREVARHLPKSKHVIVEQGHHGMTGISNIQCLDGLILPFLEKGSADGLDAACTATMKRPAWVIDYEAWKAEQEKQSTP